MAIIRRYLAKFPAKFASHHPDFLNLLQLSEKNEPKPQNKEKRTTYKASFVSLKAMRYYSIAFSFCDSFDLRVILNCSRINRPSNDLLIWIFSTVGAESIRLSMLPTKKSSLAPSRSNVD